jgi:hypothetical protein
MYMGLRYAGTDSVLVDWSRGNNGNKERECCIKACGAPIQLSPFAFNPANVALKVRYKLVSILYKGKNGSLGESDSMGPYKRDIHRKMVWATWFTMG